MNIKRESLCKDRNQYNNNTISNCLKRIRAHKKYVYKKKRREEAPNKSTKAQA